MLARIAFSILFAMTASAAETPAWVERAPKADEVFRYYVGRATGETSESQAYRAAQQDAMEAAIRENFGVVTSINVTNVESTNYRALDKRMIENSPRVRLEDFEMVESHLERAAGLISVHVLYRYKAAAIADEKARLAKGSELATVPTSEAGEVGNGTELIVQSTPSGAEVLVDEIRWGVTPVAIRGALCPGPHTVELRHPRFADVAEKVILATHQQKLVKKILRPAFATLHVTSRPNRAEIYIDGVRRGQAPLSVAQIPIEKTVAIEARFSSRDGIIRTLQLRKGEERSIAIELPSDDKPATETSFTESDSELLEELTAGPFIVGAGLEIDGANIPQPYGQQMTGLVFSFERRFLYRLGLRAKYAIDTGIGDAKPAHSSQGASNPDQLAGHSYGLGLPIYFSSRPTSYYIMPEVGGIDYLQQFAGTPRVIEFNYRRSGFTFGYQDPSSYFNLYVSAYNYDWKVAGTQSAITVGAILVYGK